MTGDFFNNPLRMVSSEAKRASEAYNQALANNGLDCVGQWIAIRLSDGGSDGNLYPSKADAVRFQLHETQCCYLQILPEGLSERAAQSVIHVNRQLYDAGMNLADPDRMVELPQREETWKQHGLRTHWE